MSALAVKSKSISENEVGMGQTTSWRVCSLSGDTSIAVYYEIVNQHSNPIPAGTPFYLQFCVRYKRSNGEIRLRVMTVARRWAESAAAHDIVSGFDQEACALLMARVSTFRVEHEETFDLLRWLDRTLIRVGSKFGEYAKDSPETFRMPGPFAIYPQFMFNLRRSQFIQVIIQALPAVPPCEHVRIFTPARSDSSRSPPHPLVSNRPVSRSSDVLNIRLKPIPFQHDSARN